MRAFWRYLASTTCVALGVLLAAASAFLVYWKHAAHGERDIAARGGIMLFFFLPWIMAASWVLVAGLVARPLRRAGFGWWSLLGISLAAVVLSAILEFLPPLFLVLRLLAILPQSARPLADFALAGVLIVAGLATAQRSLSNREPNDSLKLTGDAR